MILFGVRSPLVVELEETLARLGIAVTAAISINGVPRVTDRSRLVELDAFIPIPGAAFIASAFAPQRRRALVEQAVAMDLVKARAIIDPTAILPRSARVGDATFINAGVVIGAITLIGEGVLVNRAASLGHHTVLSDFASVGPGATLAGNVHVGANAVIGAGTTILPDVRIGENAIISAGSVVRKHVADGAFVAGNPAVSLRFKPRRSALNVEDGE
ncbi:MAG TPA: hypothetical protein VLM36_10255 [Sphingomicrobium sp.]|nr:hypothetical protein [Sphingomicrobium sp.]